MFESGYESRIVPVRKIDRPSIKCQCVITGKSYPWLSWNDLMCDIISILNIISSKKRKCFIDITDHHSPEGPTFRETVDRLSSWRHEIVTSRFTWTVESTWGSASIL